MAEWGWERGKVRGFYCVPISKAHDQRFFKKTTTTTDDPTLRDHMIDDVLNVIDRFVISKYRRSHAYCLIKLELLQFASNLLHFALLWFITFGLKVITFWVTEFITFCVESYYILGYYYILRQKLLHFGSIETSLNQDLSNINRWLIANKLTLNMTKTEFMLMDQDKN